MRLGSLSMAFLRDPARVLSCSGELRLCRSGDLGPNRTATEDLPGDAPRSGETNSAERACTPDREARPPRPRPVSPDPVRTPAPAAKNVKPYQITEGGYFIPRLPSPNSCLTPGELSELGDLLHEFRDRFNDGMRPLWATNLLKARLETGNTPPMSFLPMRLSPAVREVVRSAVSKLDTKGITVPGQGSGAH